MLAESTAVSLINQCTIPEALQHTPSGYYRSKLFITASGGNPLIAAASPLLSLLERLCISPNLPRVDAIRDNIEHELFAFRSRLTSQHYANEFIVIAYYLMCATIDELLGKNYLRLHQRPAEFKAFTPSSHDEIGPEQRFFTIVNHLKQRTQQHLDLLELSYYCLITGFEGEYHVRADGRQALDNLIEELHQLIQQHRVHKPHRLFKKNPEIAVVESKHKSIMAMSMIVVGMLTSLYFGGHSFLEHKAKALILSNVMLTDMED